MKVPNRHYVRLSGPYACWSIPHGPERVSSLVPSHDAASGILRSVYGQWEMRWVVSELRFLKRPRKLTTTFNELKELAIAPGRKPVAIEAQRTQRSNTILCDVDYLLTAHIEPSGFGTHEVNMAKFHAMFLDRMAKGKQWKQAYLGQREYTGTLELVSEVPEPVGFDADLGLHYYGYDFRTKTPYFAHLEIKGGVLKYPSWGEVLSYGMKGVAV